ncbi:hypothetical protein [Nonomuraea sp. NPDC050310]|uniref:hypothetical protein n=1 Tax=Nonomuraea sp. NPDC050310 TaxID=3154935 RepID=UPI00340C2ECC
MGADRCVDTVACKAPGLNVEILDPKASQTTTPLGELLNDGEMVRVSHLGAPQCRGGLANGPEQNAHHRR